VQVTQFYRDSK